MNYEITFIFFSVSIPDENIEMAPMGPNPNHQNQDQDGHDTTSQEVSEIDESEGKFVLQTFE